MSFTAPVYQIIKHVTGVHPSICVKLGYLEQEVYDGQTAFGTTFEKLLTLHGQTALAKMFAKQAI